MVCRCCWIFREREVAIIISASEQFDINLDFYRGDVPGGANESNLNDDDHGDDDVFEHMTVSNTNRPHSNETA